MERARRLINAAMTVAVVCGAGWFAAWLVASRPEPARSTEPVRVPEVLVRETCAGVFDAPVVGFGTVRPKNQIKVVPQVSGTLTDMHPDLAVGNVIRKDELLFEIDRRPYESQVLQVEADIRLLELELQRHEQERANLTQLLEDVARRQLVLAETEYEREKELLATGATRQVEVDAAQQEYLQAKDKVLAYENKLSLIPTLVAETRARLEARQAQLADAQRNVEYTHIRCPFDARVDVVSAKKAQVVIANLAVAVLTDLEAFELAAVLDPSDLQWTERRAYARAMGGDLGEPPEVSVVWTLHGHRYSWRGAVSRLEKHDEATRTAHLVIEIPNLLDEVVQEEAVGKPQLSIGMFCKAEIPADPLQDALVVPRSAVQEDNVVYVFEPDVDSPDGLNGRLAARRVPLLRTVGDDVLVDFAGRGEDDRLAMSQSSAICELRAGDLLIVSPLARSVVGMKLRLREAGVASVSELESALAMGEVASTPGRSLRWRFSQQPVLSILPLELGTSAAGSR